MKYLRLTALLCLTAFIASRVAAQTLFVTPTGYGSTNGDRELNLPLSGAGQATGGTFQYTIPANNLGGLGGQTLYGLAFRLNSVFDPALGAFSFTNYSIEISGSAQNGDLGRTFASNVTGNDVIVRSGPLAFGVGVFPRADSSSQVNGFGPVIEFTTPYSYTSGGLLITLRMSGVSGLTSTFSLDAVFGSGGGFFYDDTSATATQGLSPTPGNYTPVTGFATSPVPEPSTYAALAGVGALGLALWRRRNSGRVVAVA